MSDDEAKKAEDLEEFWAREWEKSLAVLTSLGIEVEILPPIRLSDLKGPKEEE